MKLQLKFNLVLITICVSFLLFFAGVQVLLYEKALSKFSNPLLYTIHIVLLLSLAAIILNLMMGIINVNKLQKINKFHIELNEINHTFNFLVIDVVTSPLLFLFHNKNIEGSFSDISHVDLKKFGNTDIKILIIKIKGRSKKIRLTNKNLDEIDFYKIIDVLERNQITVIK